MMRSEKEMYDLILNEAKNNPPYQSGDVTWFKNES